MNAHFIPRKQTGLFSEKQLLLSENQEQLASFIGLPFSKEKFEKQIHLKSSSYPSIHRTILVEELQIKYAFVPEDSSVFQQIQLLKKDTTFTVTTGHQLSLLTGPLYFILKIAHVIKLCKELKAFYPQYDFVPVYWMASEDHDFDEIKSLKIFGKDLTWNKEASGAVGRLNLDGFDEVKQQFQSFFESHPASEIHALLTNFQDEATYGEAFFQFIHTLFEQEGLVILDGDNAVLKQSFSPVFEKEIQEQFSFKRVVETSKSLEEKGFKIQVNPREINLFYLNENKRERLIQNDNGFIAGDKQFSESEVLAEIHSNPENFSPNVVLRPLYQEWILPNLAYIGGLGELNYWLQLKEVFDDVSIPYPIIQPRTSALWLDTVSQKKWEQLSLQNEQLFESIHVVKKNYLASHEEDSIDFQLLDFQLENLITEWQKKANDTDPSLSNWVNAEWVRISKQTDVMKQKMEKAVKSKHEKALKTIEQVKEKLFPDGGLHERSVNFFQFCPDGNYTQRIQHLIEIMKPFSSDFIILQD